MYKLKILVVDDESRMRKLVRDFLVKDDFDVVEAGDGYLVKDAVRVEEPGSDVSFSIMLEDGWQFLGTDYRGETEAVRGSDGKTVQLTLKDVKYSETICHLRHK